MIHFSSKEYTSPKFHLIETILLESARYFLLDLHLQRLKSSARFFKFQYNLERIRSELQLLAEANPFGKHRVRLLLNYQGKISLEIKTLEERQSKIERVILAKQAINRNNLFHYHKTTNREIYDLHSEENYFDTILFNDKLEVTETRIGNLVFEKDGKLYTPPLECGLLAGTFRQHLINEGQLTKKVVQVDEMQNYDKIFLINSVRKFVQLKIEIENN